MDPRRLRSQLLLSDAVLTLAAKQSLAGVTATDIAKLAGVNRSTFYEHASSPEQLLAATLTRELDEIRAVHLAAIDSKASADQVSDAVSNVARAVIEHVAAHDAIYRVALHRDTASPSLHSMLADHFERSIATLIEVGAVQLPSGSPASLATLAPRSVAYAAVGAIDAWLHSGPGAHRRAGDHSDSTDSRDSGDHSGADNAPRVDIDDFLRDLQLLFPSWWPFPDEQHSE
ncbi:TetR/AcrR family transcriptional regulator [Humidisolicoccus flavus]|uniref:TetR/AcrR family transcriptional regulator n=1 Tax=Humidisolicoccus flavus TaxID=3111414 RepID=UPI00324477C6